VKINLPILLTVLVALAGVPCFAGKTHAPLPPKILAAKTVYVENHGSAKLADKAYTELKQWGRFEIVTDRIQADIVLLLSLDEGQTSSGKTQTYDPKANGGYGGWKYGRIDESSSGSIHIEVLDAKTGETLYSDTKQMNSFTSATHGAIKDLRQRIEEQEKASKKIS
jgi:hypothetical protein